MIKFHAVCPLGKWGKECMNNCGACSAFACRHDNGSCEMGCFSGFEGPLCNGMYYWHSSQKYLYIP